MSSEDSVTAKLPVLTPTNYHVWSSRIRGLADAHGVWQFVNPLLNTTRPIRQPPPSWRNIIVTIDVTARQPPNKTVTQEQRLALNPSELSPAQKLTLKEEQTDWSITDQWIKYIDHSLTIIHTAITSSAQDSLTSNLLGASCQDIMRFLHN